MQRLISIAAHTIAALLALLAIGTLLILTISGEVLTGIIGASLYLASAIIVIQTTRIHSALTSHAELLELMLEQLRRTRPRSDE